MQSGIQNGFTGTGMAELPEKPVTMAIKEVAAGELTAGLKEEYRK